VLVNQISSHIPLSLFMIRIIRNTSLLVLSMSELRNWNNQSLMTKMNWTRLRRLWKGSQYSTVAFMPFIEQEEIIRLLYSEVKGSATGTYLHSEILIRWCGKNLIRSDFQVEENMLETWPVPRLCTTTLPN